MRLMRLAVRCAAVVLVACDGTVGPVTGIARGGGTTQRVLVFSVQPSTATAGNAITPPVQVVAQDTLGNTDATFVGTVTVALGANPTSAFLDGTKSVAAASGVAIFGDLSVSRVGSGYTLVASAPGATGATSGAFNITAP